MNNSRRARAARTWTCCQPGTEGFTVAQVRERIAQTGNRVGDVGQREWLPAEHQRGDVVPGREVLRRDHRVAAGLEDAVRLSYELIDVEKMFDHLIRRDDTHRCVGERPDGAQVARDRFDAVASRGRGRVDVAFEANARAPVRRVRAERRAVPAADVAHRSRWRGLGCKQAHHVEVLLHGEVEHRAGRAHGPDRDEPACPGRTCRASSGDFSADATVTMTRPSQRRARLRTRRSERRGSEPRGAYRTWSARSGVDA